MAVVVLRCFVALDILRKHGGKFCSVEPVDRAFNGKHAVLERVELAEVAEYVADGLRRIVGSERNEPVFRGVITVWNERERAGICAGGGLSDVFSQAGSRDFSRSERSLCVGTE